MHLKRTTLRLIAMLPCSWLVAAGLTTGCKQSEKEPVAPHRDAEVSDLNDPNLARIVGKKGMNVIFVSVDTTRADHVGCYGHPLSKTPNIDKLAAEGARFTQCISAAPLTLVSHSTMMTGSYQFVHGARDNTAFKLGPENRTLAEIFSEVGYATRAEVATVILDAQFGLNQGFDIYNSVPSAAKAVENLKTPELDAAKATFVEGEDGLGQLKIDRLAVSITDAGIKNLQEFVKEDKSFFMFLHYYDPHWPHETHEDFSSKFVDPYLAEIAYFDFHFGRLMDEVDRLGLAEKTLVVLVSDHGEGKGEHGERTHSCFIYDSTLHVPCIMRCRGTIPAGLVITPQVRLIDMAPTILEFVELASLKTPQMQGASLLPLLANPQLTPALQAYADSIVPQLLFGYSPLRALRTAEHKYIHSPAPELYDLKEDALEVFNKVELEENLTKDMRQMLYDLIANSPAPPGSRASVSANDEETLEKLRALGYIGTGGSLDYVSQGSELDQFEPVGDNPREHIEEIELLTGGMGAVRIGDFKLAEAGLRRLVELRPDHAVATSSLASALWGLKKYAEAEIWFRKAIELSPTECRLKAQHAVVLRYLFRYQEAEAEFREVLKCATPTASGWSDLAGILFEQQKYQECLDALAEADKLSPNSPLVLTQRALALSRFKKYEDALTEVERAIKIEPKLPRAHSTKGVILGEMGRHEDAVAYLTHCLKVDPKLPMVRFQLAQHYMALKKNDAAQRELKTIIEDDPESTDARLVLVGILISEGKKAEAIEQLRKAREVDPESSTVHIQLAAALLDAGDFTEALNIYRTVLEKWPTQQLYRDVANVVSMRMNQEAAAIEFLQKGVIAFPEDAAIHNDLAWRLATSPDDKLRDGKKALELAQRASGYAEGDNPFFLDTLAAAFAETGDFEQAVTMAQRAKSLAMDMKADAVANEIGTRLELYKNQKPYREKPAVPK